ncbi:MAG: hypothetical protein ACOH1T_08035 [Microbacteriaceae bacterium]
MLPALPVLLLVNGASGATSPMVGYWTWTVAHSILLILVPAAVSATGAALEASRLRSARATNPLNLRPAPLVLIDALWPSLVAGLVLQAVAIALIAINAPGGDSRVPTELLVAITAMIFMHTALGFTFGSLFRAAIGVPLALVASYSWLGFTGTIDWAPLRHLAGLVLETCCSIDEQPVQASVAAVTVFSFVTSIGLLFAAAALLRTTPIRIPLAAMVAAAVITVATIAGLAIASTLTTTSAEQRAASEAVCSGDRVKVCLFPEQLADVSLPGVVEQMILRLGLPATSATEVFAGSGSSTPERIAFRYVPGMTTDQIARSLSSGFNGDQILQCDEPIERSIARSEVGEMIRGWMYVTMLDPSPSSLDEGDPALQLPSFGELLSSTKAEQASWIASRLPTLSDCDLDPEPRVGT